MPAIVSSYRCPTTRPERMNKISTYIFGQTALVMFFVTVVLSFVIWLTQSLRFVDLVVNRGLPITDFLWLAMLIVPRWLTGILPLACVVAVVYVYNRLIADRELVVLRAAGFSNLRLAGPAMGVAVVTMLIVFVLNIYLLPVSFRQFKELYLTASSDYSAILLQEGSFQTLPQRRVIFIRERIGAGRFNGILFHDAGNPDQPVTYMAESGALVRTEAGSRIVLINGNRQQFDRDRGTVSFLAFEKNSLDLDLATGVAPGGRKRGPEEMFLWELFDPVLAGDTTQTRYRAEAHSRMVSPFLAFGFVVMALAILLSGDFARRGQVNRVVMAIIVVVVLQTAAIAAHNLASDNARMIPLLYAGGGLPIAVGLLILSQAAGRRVRVRSGDTRAA
ncbi:MAG: LPS export ABC transporter permease LptF [Rhodospirillales bacterium]|nr:MAG: LPS export ABC transporter permease LptF [Rhodospirillales bacterium]